MPIVKFLEELNIVGLATDVNGQLTPIEVQTVESENNEQTLLSNAKDINWIEGEL